MERKALKGLDLSDTQIDGVMKLYNKDVDPLKENMANVQSEIDSYKSTIADRDSQLDELKKTAGDNKDLQSQIEQLKNENKKATEELNTKLADVKKDSAIKLSLKDSKAKDADMVFNSLNLDDIELTSDGKLKGLDSQLDEFKKSHDYMFEPEPAKDPEPKPSPINAMAGGNPSGSQSEQETLVQKIASRMAKA